MKPFSLIAIIAIAALTPSTALANRPAEIAAQPVLEVDTTLDVSDMLFPEYVFTPVIYNHHYIDRPVDPFNLDSINAKRNPYTEWADRRLTLNRQINSMIQRYMFAHPDDVRYNTRWMPEPPKEYHAVLDPRTNMLIIEAIEITPDAAHQTVGDVDLKRRNWLKGYESLLQFSQAYVSPNWYQGGNNNLNMIFNAQYNVKLNEKFHPNLMFDNTFRYKLAMYSAPDDSLRNYSISEDLLQINSKFGLKAAKNWYYSVTGQFKTQLFNGYKSNTNELKSSFMSPGELNVGLGMTYNHTTNAVKIDVSISPLSYNLKTCLNRKMNPTAFGIKEGHRWINQYGSTLEAKMVATLARNITYTGRFFAFTNYEYVQGDLENTFSFDFNRYISTQIYVHLRYDTSTDRIADSDWHRWQLKEILSFGLSYKFSNH